MRGYVEFVRVCPPTDTEALRSYGDARTQRLLQAGLAGYIVAGEPPQCGRRTCDANQSIHCYTPDVIVDTLTEHLSWLPVETDVRLCDDARCTHFLERVFAYERLRRHLAADPALTALPAFHGWHRLQLFAHDPERCRALDRLVDHVRPWSRAVDVREAYGRLFSEALALPVCPDRQAEAMMLAVGELAGIDDRCRSEIVDRIAAYRHGEVPLTVPLDLLTRQVRSIGSDAVRRQTYFHPCPAGLGPHLHDASVVSTDSSRRGVRGP
ncbi:Uncharacterized conserved protein YbgA, DUF1722 family [Actinopolymorpha cephalotaxi]|uniref:Uncharacterized conserved protein YbgA, DUF1722 family n=1 Tax=Actinopolymorpha cephalotaxi TaxID=504797 RepID=A0A1I2YBB4_9ACTN|nr:DUF1722 domain-containing protein [Actinopolymorpha cephalotaxi]NYH87052.1 uncharacterized protein YbgA (DUF1722 family) [Actinopolymorpha cephalotaxi]SFH23014.1 Uncharacterized conserved protein YbgA, DUF1722 family [Actinopolymorpha cephalotaxi]